MSNANRGLLAEFIVASALGAAEVVRSEWASHDLVTSDGKRIEVKCAAYIQSWHQSRLSKIVFGIQPTRGWDAATNKFEENLRRQADIYIFCLLDHKHQATIDPLNLDQWRFFVLKTDVLNKHCPIQKTIGLKKLLSMNPIKVSFENLGNCISDI